MTDTTALIARHEQRVERIRNNPDLSESAKRRMLAETYEEAVREHARMVAEAREEAEPTNADVLASVVGPRRPPELGG